MYSRLVAHEHCKRYILCTGMGNPVRSPWCFERAGNTDRKVPHGDGDGIYAAQECEDLLEPSDWFLDGCDLFCIVLVSMTTTLQGIPRP